MVESALVNEDVEAARRLVSFLDENGYPVKAALWLYQSEAERWRFVISFRESRADVTTFYRDIANLINEKGQADGLLDLYKVDVVDAERSVVGPLSKVIRVDGLSNVRFTNNRVNGVFLEDALIFRLSA